MMKDGQVKPVTYSRDTQEIPFNEGKKMVEILQDYMNQNTILEHFEYYDQRQENYEKTLQVNYMGNDAMSYITTNSGMGNSNNVNK